MKTVNFNGKAVKIAGHHLKVGHKAPVVKLVNKDLQEVEVGGKKDVVQILIAVPSLDTPVCATEAMKFNSSIAGKEGVCLSIISMDLPFAQSRFCESNNAENIKTLSDFVNKDFGKEYGLLIEEGPLKGLLARAIFVVDTTGHIIYEELVSEVTEEPNYEALKEAMMKSGQCSSSCGCSK